MFLSSKLKNNRSEQYALACMKHHFVSRFEDVLVLIELLKGSSNGYRLIKAIQTNTSVTISPGAMYGILAVLKQHNFITITTIRRTRMCSLTDSGKVFAEFMLKMYTHIPMFVACTAPDKYTEREAMIKCLKR